MKSLIILSLLFALLLAFNVAAQTQPECKLKIDKIDFPDPAYPGGFLAYRITVTNVGSDMCTGTGVKLTEYYDEMTKFLTAEPGPNEGNDSWILGELKPGDTREVDILMKVSDEAGCGYEIVNRACVWAEELSEEQCTEEVTGVVENPLVEYGVESCSGDGEIFLYQGDVFQPLNTSFITNRSELLVFARSPIDLQIFQNGYEIPLSVAFETEEPFGVVVYSAETIPGSVISVKGSHEFNARGIQAYLAQDPSRPVFDLHTMNVLEEGEIISSAYLIPGTYSYLIFDKYSEIKPGEPDDRELNISILKEGETLVDDNYDSPFPEGIEGVVLGSYGIGEPGEYEMRITTEDSVYWSLYQCREPVCEPQSTQLCGNQQGVCSGSFQTCDEQGQWPGCDYSMIPGFELEETSCDGLDNDCDGLIDEGCHPPTASITNPSDGDSFKTGQNVVFSGVGDNENITSYLWESSIDGEIGNVSTFSTNALSVGEHLITFTVEDDDGQKASDSITIFINEPEAPTASIISPVDGSDYRTGHDVTFIGLADDPDGEIVSVEWVSDIDGVFGDTLNFEYDNLSLGTHQITLTVTDDDGLSASDSVSITVKALQAPTAVIINPNNGDHFKKGEMISFVGDGSDPDGEIVSWVWDSSIDGVFGNEKEFNYSGLSLGRHDITLTVTDDDELAYTDTFTIYIVVDPLTSPNVTILSPQPGTYFENESILFNATVEDDGSIIGYSWASSIDGELLSGEGLPPEFTLNTLSLGNHGITLTVTDDENLTTSVSVEITVVPSTAPHVVILSPEPGSVFNEGDSIDFLANITDDGNITGIVWNSNLDGNIGYEQSFSRSLSTGEHQITLFVTDDENLTGTASVSIIVKTIPPQPPPSNGGGPGVQIYSGSGSSRKAVCGDNECSETVENCTSCPEDCGACEVEEICEESWTCSDWSECSEGYRTRDCTDANECGTSADRPETVETCAPEVALGNETKPSVGSELPPGGLFFGVETGILAGVIIIIIIIALMILASLRKKD